MRIAIFTDNFREDMGGGTKIVIDLARGLRERGHEVLIVTGQGTDSSAEGFKVVHLPSVRVPMYDKAEMIFPSMGLIKEVKAFKPDLIHYHEPFTAGMLALIVSGLMDVPVVGSIYIDPKHLSEYSLKLDRGILAKTLVGFMGRQSDALVFISKYQRDTYRRFLPKRLRVSVIYPGIPEVFFTEGGVAERRRRVLTVCRLAPEKNLEFAFSVMAKVQRSVPVEYVLVGDGPKRRSLEKLAQRLSLKVTFLGNVKRERIRELYRSSALLFLPSKTETFGLVFAEAMACGTPVVALNRGSAPEVVGDGGLVCEENRDAVANAVVSLIEDENLWREKSARARKRAELFRTDRFVKEHEDLYRQLVDQELN